MSTAPTIYIFLPVFNRKKITLQFVQRLKNQTNQNFKLILIDDGSTDGTSTEVKNMLPEVIILKGGNLWWAGSLQLGIKYLKKIKVSQDTPVLIMNDDTIFNEHFLEKGVTLVDNNPNSLICASMIMNGEIRPSAVHINWEDFSFKATEKNDVNCLPTRGLFLRFRDIIKIGEFRPRLLPHYLSDYEFTHRAFTKGFKLLSPNDLWLEPMLQETGIRFLEGKGINYLRKLFSKRCTSNPYYSAIFILLAAPGASKLPNLRRLFIKTIKQIRYNII